MIFSHVGPPRRDYESTYVVGLRGAYAGHINHSLFWKNLAPAKSEGKGNGGAIQDGPLKAAIVQNWGSVDAFIKEFNATTAAIQGSGWGWLVSTLPVPSLPLLFSSVFCDRKASGAVDVLRVLRFGSAVEADAICRKSSRCDRAPEALHLHGVARV